MRSWMRVQFFVFYFSWVTFLSYWGIYLNARGFNPTEIGMSITASLVTRGLAVAVLFPLVNRHVGILRLTRALGWLSLACGILFVPDMGYVSLIVVSSAFGILYPTMMPVLETIGTLGAQRGHFAYGPTRLFGSAGFVIGTIVNALVSEYFGNESLIWLFLFGCAAMSVLALRPLRDEVLAQQTSGPLGSWGELVGRRLFWVVLIIVIVTQSAHGAYYAFGALRLQDLGISDQLIGITLIVAPISEMVVFQLSGRKADSMSIPWLLGVAAAAGVLRWLVWAFSTNAGLLLASQTLHGLTFALMQIGFLQFLRRHVPPHLVTPAQSAYAALGTGIGTAAATALAGVFFQTSPTLTFVLMAGISALGVIASPFLISPLRTATHQELSLPER